MYHLLICDPDCDRKLEEVILRTDDEDVRNHAARVRVDRAAEQGLEVLDRLIAAVPALDEYELTGPLRHHLAEHGAPPLY